MPIRPENRDRYPKDWPQIRARILERAGNKCEWCGVANGAIGTRGSAGKFYELSAGESESAALEGEKVVKIVLTIAHVHDHSPENCADSNLAALCQRCHNRHDARHRSGTRARTREAKEAAAGQMFLGVNLS